LIKAINDTEREEFDALFRNVNDKVFAWHTAAKNLDTGIGKLNDEINAGIVVLSDEATEEKVASQNVAKVAQEFEKPIQERKQM